MQKWLQFRMLMYMYMVLYAMRHGTFKMSLNVLKHAKRPAMRHETLLQCGQASDMIVKLWAVHHDTSKMS